MRVCVVLQFIAVVYGNDVQSSDRVTVNNDNEHHKKLYVQDHQRHQAPSSISRVLELSDRFLEIVNTPLHNSGDPNTQIKYAPWLVKFYAPWCGHCKRLEPVFNHVAQALHNTAIRVGKIDCTRFPVVSSEFKIHGFPTIMFISGPRKHVFQGDRTVDEIVKFAKRMNSPATKQIQDLNEFIDKLPHEQVYPNPTKESSASPTVKISDHPDLFFGLLRPTPSLIDEITSSFRQVAQLFQQHIDFYEFNSPSSSSSVIFAYKHGRIITYNPVNTVNLTDSIKNWVSNERYPDVIPLTRTSMYSLFQSHGNEAYNHRNLIVAGVVNQDKLHRIVDDDQAELVRMIIHLSSRAVTNTISNTINLGVSVPVTSSHVPVHYAVISSPELANSIVAEVLQLPAILIIEFESQGNHKYYVFNEHIHDVLVVENLIELTGSGHFTPYVYASSWRFKAYAYAFDAYTSVSDMWVGNPVLTVVLFGLPLGFLSLILYSICCGDILDAKESEEDEDALLDSEDESHEKRE